MFSPFLKEVSIKIDFGLNHFKCIGHTSNKIDLSPDIIPTRIDDKYKNQVPHLLKIFVI